MDGRSTRHRTVKEDRYEHCALVCGQLGPGISSGGERLRHHSRAGRCRTSQQQELHRRRHAPRQDRPCELALQMLRQAERFREEIALQWLGGPLPEGQGRVVINLRVSHDRDEGLTWACDSQDRLCHTIYLVTSPQRALGSTLKHEIAHAVLATHFSHPHRLPSWLEEAIASDYDDASRKSTRQRILLQRLRSAECASMVELL